MGDLHLQALFILVWGQGGANFVLGLDNAGKNNYHSLYPRTCSPRIYMSCGSGGFCLFVCLCVLVVWFLVVSVVALR
jgi:hypothetical protein